MDEWQIDSKPIYIEGVSIELQMQDDSLRVCEWRNNGYSAAMLFQDCTHPLQNMIVDTEKIKAWRLNPAKNPAK